MSNLNLVVEASPPSSSGYVVNVLARAISRFDKVVRKLSFDDVKESPEENYRDSTETFRR